MPLTKQIPISQIVIDNLPINLKTLSLIDYIRNNPNIILPPITVQIIANGKYKLKDGRYRYLAFKMLEISMINAKVQNKKLLPLKLGNIRLTT
jgi:hypothetical protein